MTDTIMRLPFTSDNLSTTQRILGQELRKLVRTYDRQIEKHVGLIEEIHQTILEIGRRLRTGRDLHRSNKDFGLWCQRYGLDQGAFRDQQERTAAMLIAELHDDGVAPLGLEEDTDGTEVAEADRIRLDLTGCRRTGPTNIMSWARKHQPELFPHLAAKREAARRKLALKPKPDGEDSSPIDDEVLLAPDGVETLKARVTELEQERVSVTELEQALADKTARIAELESPSARKVRTKSGTLVLVLPTEIPPPPEFERAWGEFLMSLVQHIIKDLDALQDEAFFERLRSSLRYVEKYARTMKAEKDAKRRAREMRKAAGEPEPPEA